MQRVLYYVHEGTWPGGRNNPAGLTDREATFWRLVKAIKHMSVVREYVVQEAAKILTPAEVLHAMQVIALFQFYNTFVDLNGVDELTPEGYKATGVRLSTHGYRP